MKHRLIWKRLPMGQRLMKQKQLVKQGR